MCKTLDIVPYLVHGLVTSNKSNTQSDHKNVQWDVSRTCAPIFQVFIQGCFYGSLQTVSIFQASHSFISEKSFTMTLLTCGNTFFFT